MLAAPFSCDKSLVTIAKWLRLDCLKGRPRDRPWERFAVMPSVRAAALAAAALCAAAPPLAAQIYVVPPDFTGEPVSGSEAGLGLPIPDATPEEYSAALVWGMRSGLNVAALQCARNEFYDTTGNYNALLTDHRKELASAYQTLTNYFSRSNGGSVSAKKTVMTRAGMNALNQYDTRSYNGWSTLYAQRGFCYQASQVGKALRFVPIGGLLPFAQANMRSLRNSLVFAGDPLFATRRLYLPAPELRYSDNCYDKRGDVKAKCLR